jgi:hypothetical protein
MVIPEDPRDVKREMLKSDQSCLDSNDGSNKGNVKKTAEINGNEAHMKMGAS